MKKYLKISMCLGIFLSLANSLPPQKFGIGLAVGDPTGITAKYWAEEKQALQVLLGIPTNGNDKVEGQVNYLLHWIDPFEINDSHSYVHFGAGGRMKVADDFGMGGRLPVALNYYAFDSFEFYFEGAAGIDILPKLGFNPDISLGFHYYFK